MFAVIHVEAVPDHLRGYLSRFLQEVRTGVYVGVVTRTVADDLWDAVRRTAIDGAATCVTSDPTVETGYQLQIHNVHTHRIANIDGIDLPIETPRQTELIDNPKT